MPNNPAPPVTMALIEWLESVFRNRVPDMDWTDRQVWAAVESGMPWTTDRDSASTDPAHLK